MVRGRADGLGIGGYTTQLAVHLPITCNDLPHGLMLPS